MTPGELERGQAAKAPVRKRNIWICAVFCDRAHPIWKNVNPRELMMKGSRRPYVSDKGPHSNGPLPKMKKEGLVYADATNGTDSTNKTKPRRYTDIVSVPTIIEKSNSFAMSSMMPDGAELAKLARPAKRLEKTTKYQRKMVDQFYRV